MFGMQILDFKPLWYRVLYEPSFENKHRWKAGSVTFVDEKQLIRIADGTLKNSTASRHLFPVCQNLLYFILFHFCHTFSLSVWRPYCQVNPRVRRCVVRNFWPCVSVCYFGGLFMSGFEATDGAYEAPFPPHTPVAGSKRKARSAYGWVSRKPGQRTENQLPQPLHSWQVNQFPHSLQWALWLLVKISKGPLIITSGLSETSLAYTGLLSCKGFCN